MAEVACAEVIGGGVPGHQAHAIIPGHGWGTA